MSDEFPKEVEFYIDKAGQEVRVGDYIAYGHNLGRCAGLRFGKVHKITQKKAEAKYSFDSEMWSITVRGIEDDWSHQEAKPLERKSSLSFPERTIKINGSIPTKYKDMLDALP